MVEPGTELKNKKREIEDRIEDRGQRSEGGGQKSEGRGWRTPVKSAAFLTIVNFTGQAGGIGLS
jgi:hypothetical protein